MNRDDIEQFFQEVDHVASTPQIAMFFNVPATFVRSFAAENGVPMIGNAFAFTLETAEQFATEALDLDLDLDEEEAAEEEEAEEEEAEQEDEADTSDSDWEEDQGSEAEEEEESDDCHYEVVEKVYYR